MGLNSKCGVQSRRKPCICTAGFSSCWCQKKSAVCEMECRHVAVHGRAAFPFLLQILLLFTILDHRYRIFEGIKQKQNKNSILIPAPLSQSQKFKDRVCFVVSLPSLQVFLSCSQCFDLGLIRFQQVGVTIFYFPNF